MLERCARAAAKAAGNFDYDGFNEDTRAKYDRIARAVLQALLEPTPGMAYVVAKAIAEEFDQPWVACT